MRKEKKPSINDQIKERIGTEKFLKSLYPEAKASHNSVMFLCPFHDEKNPSIAIYLNTGRGKCFACGRTTDLVELYAVKNSVSIQEACKQILKQLGGN